MPRHARLDAEGVLHHIIVRGIERRAIFRDDVDKDRFLERLGRVLTDTRTPCYAWALLRNHAHLLLKTGTVPLSTVMARLLTGHAVTFNKRHHRHGQLFQNRYKSILCEEDAYLTALVCYLHLNPLRARIVNDLADLSRYPYSGHRALTGKALYPWQDVDYVLRHFGATAGPARRHYLSAMRIGLAKGKRPDLVGGGLVRSYGSWKEVKEASRLERIKGDERILGDSDFVARILPRDRLSSRAAASQAGVTLDALAAHTAALCATTVENLRSRNRNAHLVEARSLFCFWAVRRKGFPAAQVAAFLAMTAPGVGYPAERGETVAREKGHLL